MVMRKHHPIMAGCACALAAFAFTEGLSGAKEQGDASRYPYDPACAWGRLANGKGMLLRCLTKDEAQQLQAGSGVKRANPPGARGPLADAGSPPAASAAEPSPSEPSPKPSPDSTSIVPRRATIVSVRADQGELPMARRKLATARERFVKCAREHGGLTEPKATVEVRFLVRERGRAEGVSVKKRSGLSRAAAQCIADVVDRRYVGIPAAPIVGASVEVTVSGR